MPHAMSFTHASPGMITEKKAPKWRPPLKLGLVRMTIRSRAHLGTAKGDTTGHQVLYMSIVHRPQMQYRVLIFW